MTKYIDDLVKEFLSRKSGIEKNASLWQAMPVKVEEIDTIVASFKTIEKDIDDALALVQQLRAKARAMEAEKRSKITQIDNLAYGLHNDDASQLLNYGITLKKGSSAKAIPNKGVVKSIIDDYDGEGFIVERESLQEADNYEWQKAKGDDAAITNIDENKFMHFKVSRVKSFVDDEIKKGVRYFYRFRGFNAAGHGAWSEPVSRVQ
jgi:hypothetical protein